MEIFQQRKTFGRGRGRGKVSNVLNVPKTNVGAIMLGRGLHDITRQVFSDRRSKPDSDESFSSSVCIRGNHYKNTGTTTTAAATTKVHNDQNGDRDNNNNTYCKKIYGSDNYNNGKNYKNTRNIKKSVIHVSSGDEDGDDSFKKSIEGRTREWDANKFWCPINEMWRTREKSFRKFR